MTKEALTLALEALYALTAMNHTTQQMKSNAITAIKEALAQPEPVKISHKHEWFRTGEMKIGQMRCISCGTWGQEETPQPEQEPVEWEQFYPDIGKPQIAFNAEVIGYVAPQRTWVGLTPEDTFEIGERLGLSDIAWVDLMQAIEAKLKHKNTRSQE